MPAGRHGGLSACFVFAPQLTFYAYAADRQIATYFGGHPIFNHTDWVGTIRRATALDGSVYQNSINASPWGEENYNPNSLGDASLLHFTGKERDDEDDMIYFGARFYDPNQPRFMTADWADKPEAVPYSDLADPQSLNLYTYVRNNPVSRTDPDGHCPQGPGCVMEVVEIISRVTSDPIGFAKSFFIGAGKQELATIRDNVGMSPSPSLEPANDVERAGAAATQKGQEVGAVVLPFVTGGEGEEPSGTFMGPKEGSANGEGAGQPISPANKQAAVDENVAANGGSARCVFCGQRVSNEPGPNKVNIDHAKAKSNGGNDTLDNAQVTCQYCNQSKGTGPAPKNPKPKPPQQPQ